MYGGIRFFAKVDSEEELKELSHNPFIRTGDIVLCNEEAYGFTVSGEFMKVSCKEDFTTVSFFHRFNIGDKVKLETPIKIDEAEVTDFHIHYKDREAFYVLKSQGKVFKVSVFEVDIQSVEDDNDTPLSSF